MAASELKDAIAFLSTYPPRQCGIATFTADLVRAVGGNMEGRLRTVVVAVDEPADKLEYQPEVAVVLKQHDNADYVRAAEFLNYSKVRAVSVQHEFGIFGGHDGVYLLDLLRELRCPVVTTLHTVLQHPSETQREVMDELIVLSSALVVMSERAIEFLREVYGAPAEKIRLIHHGVPEIPLVEPAAYKSQFEMDGRELVLTFGLLGPGKGVEYALQALPPVVKEFPDLCYIILGATHPNVVREQGESYRLGLQRLARDLNLQRNVLFSNRFVTLEELCEFLKATDVYLVPYLNREQITSGTLAYALGAGKPIISTPFWYAEDLLRDGRGVLVPFRDPQAMGQALLELLSRPSLVLEMRARAYEFSRRMTWGEVGLRYLDTFREAISTARVRASMPDVSLRHTVPITGLPRPKLDHLLRMTDDTGLLQHARYAVPDRAHGYCTDDNARALVAASKYYDLFREPEAERLVNTYLSFVSYAQRTDGLFHNYMGYDRRFLDKVGGDDCYGRALWGLGYAIYRGTPAYINLARETLERSLENLGTLSLRGRAYATLGLYYYLQRYPEADDLIERIDELAQKQIAQFEQTAGDDWPWFEDAVTYDNAVVPQSLLMACEVTGRAHYREVAQRSLDFLLALCDRNDHLSLVGNHGWHVRGRRRAVYDQQPIDACGLVDACKVAFRMTGERRYLRHMRMAFDWFLGVNDLGQPLYDFKTGGCADGLAAGGVNQNQGAESTVCCLLAMLSLTEMFGEQDRGAKGTATRWSTLLTRKL